MRKETLSISVMLLTETNNNIWKTFGRQKLKVQMKIGNVEIYVEKYILKLKLKYFWEIAVKIPSQKTHSGKSKLQNCSENPIPENALWSGKSNLRFPGKIL